MRWALAAVVLAAACGPDRTAPGGRLEGSAESGFEIFGPFTHENLSVFLIRKPGAPRGDEGMLTLEEALNAGALRVAEKAEGAEVNALEVENAGDRPVYIQAGDTVKGGKQDRTIAIDFSLPPRSGKTKVDVFCVEPDRWRVRQGGGLRFETASVGVATNEQKIALKSERSQSAVWEAGRKVNQALAAKAMTASPHESYVLAAEDPKVKDRTEAYVKALVGVVEGREELVGASFAVNGEPTSVEIYATTALFRKLWAKLLRAAAVEAFAARPDRPAVKVPAASDVAALLRAADPGESQVRELPNGIRMRSRLGTQACRFDTEANGELLHLQVIKR